MIFQLNLRCQAVTHIDSACSADRLDLQFRSTDCIDGPIHLSRASCRTGSRDPELLGTGDFCNQLAADGCFRAGWQRSEIPVDGSLHGVKAAPFRGFDKVHARRNNLRQADLFDLGISLVLDAVGKDRWAINVNLRVA